MTVSINETNGIGYNSYDESNYNKEYKTNTLHSHFVSAGFVPKDKGKEKDKYASELKAKPLAKLSRFNSCKYDYITIKPKVV